MAPPVLTSSRVLTQPGIPNDYALATTTFGSRLKAIEDQAFAAVAMGFRRMELGLLEAPVSLGGFEDSARAADARDAP